MADIRHRVFGRIGTISPDGKCTGIDLSSLLQWLLLFDTVVLESTRLLEIPHLLRVFGFEGLIALLKSGALRINCDAVALAQQGEARAHQRGARMISVFPFDLGIVRVANHERFISDAILANRVETGLTRGRAQKLENHLRGRLIPWNPNARQRALDQTKLDIGNYLPPVQLAIALAIRKEIPDRPVPENYVVSISQVGNGTFSVDTDIAVVCGLTNEAAAKVIAAGLGGISGLNVVIDDMRTYTALTGVQQDDLPVFDEKLDFLAGQLNPNGQSARLTRVLELTGLPDIAYEEIASTVKVEKLLEIRESPECRAFREWLWSSDDVTNEEIQQQFAGFRTKLSQFVRGKTGKTIRWAASTGPGLLPGLGTLVGSAAGLLDTFLTEKVIKEPGPLSFLGKKYRSIFE